MASVPCLTASSRGVPRHLVGFCSSRSAGALAFFTQPAGEKRSVQANSQGFHSTTSGFCSLGKGAEVALDTWNSTTPLAKRALPMLTWKL